MRRILTLPVLFVSAMASAQPTSTGTELWLTFMENLNLQFNGPPSFHIVVSSDVSTTGEVQVPFTGFSIPFSVAPLSDTVIALPTNIYYPQGDETVFNFGLRVVANDPVSVYAYHDRVYFSEAAMALPYDRLGTDHLVLAHEDAGQFNPSEFVVLATADSSVIEVVPSVLTVGFRPPGVAYTILLNEGQVFQQQAFGNLSGSRVRSLDPTKPVAVFAGARQAIVNCAGSADDHLFQQVEPLSNWGRTFRIVPFSGRNGDEVRVLASADNTTITVTGQPTLVLDSGEVADLFVDVPLTITANAPVAVGQFNDSQTCNLAVGDPCFLWVHPADHMDQRAIWNSRTGTGTPQHFVNVVADGEAGAPQVFLDGVNVGPQLQPMTGVPGVFWGQFSVAAGQHMLESVDGFQAWAYGMGDYNSYAFPLGYGPANISTGMNGPQAIAYTSGIATEQGAVVPRSTLHTRDALRVFDGAGRVVSFVPQGADLVVDLPHGLYTILPVREGRPVRLLVR